ncbi:MAG: PepSY domain-containing protein [Blastococcus sp.]|nr:PepSY domain-containing protein [Blastococcus sp.]
MRITRKLVIGVGAAAVIAASAGIAAAAGGSDEDSAEGPDVAISGDALRKASDAALAETGGGSVTGTEVGDEESYYEVEVTLDDGSQVDVQLDETFAVVGSEADSESSDDGDD